MSELQRWVWTPDGMEPYRAHPLMPDVGGVFVSAEDVARLEAGLLDAARQLPQCGGPIANRIRVYRKYWEGIIDDGDKHVDQLIADRDRWRTWAGEAREVIMAMLDAYERDSHGKTHTMIGQHADATLATYPTDGDSGAGGRDDGDGRERQN